VIDCSRKPAANTSYACRWRRLAHPCAMIRFTRSCRHTTQMTSPSRCSCWPAACISTIRSAGYPGISSASGNCCRCSLAQCVEQATVTLYATLDGLLEDWRMALDQREVLTGTGDPGIDQLAGQYRVERVGQQQGAVGELRTLGFMHGHRIYGFHGTQPAGQDKAQSLLAVVAWKHYAQYLA